ncbi:hypothetical protein PLESTM_001535500, partial [Pleodorina starrii]
ARARAPRVAATTAAAAGRPRPRPMVPPDQDAARPGRRQKTGPKAFKNWRFLDVLGHSRT